MPPNPETGLVTLPEVVAAISPESSAKFRSTTNTPTSSLDQTPTQIRRPRGLSYASRLPSHRVQTPHSVSASHAALATSAGPTGRLPLHTGPARRSYQITTRTPTPSPATTRTPTLSLASTRTPPTSSTSGRTLMSPSPRTILQSNPCQDQLPAWL
jgi:hypothetical protein